MADYVTMDSEGAPHFDYAKISRDQASVITDLMIDEFMDGKGDNARPVRRIRFKLADKRQALVDLGRHLGLWVDPSVLNLNVSNYFSEAPPSMAEWRREIEGTVNGADVTGNVTGVERPVDKKPRLIKAVARRSP